MEKSMTKERLLNFAKAWSEKSIEQIMDFFTEDCVYCPSIVDEKKKFQGKAEVQRAIERMIAMDNTIASKVSQIHIHGEFGFWEWEYTTTDLQQIRGCDYFEFSKEFIHVKNAYRKLGANRTKNDG
ncbi:nuclear transport factor 2 family protein [Maribacter sp. 2307UL18-2]|uniref:nuclear transport factor 2 family protein n=1 Tax=Maribacter sp. 2307UL18-2 TaxID=3386274 RepID=UPI0039BC2C1A